MALQKADGGLRWRPLMTMAQDVGVRGVVMECVDYRNYTPEVCKAISEFMK